MSTFKGEIEVKRGRKPGFITSEEVKEKIRQKRILQKISHSHIRSMNEGSKKLRQGKTIGQIYGKDKANRLMLKFKQTSLGEQKFNLYQDLLRQGQKQCTKCLQIKKVDQFYRGGVLTKYTDGRDSWCKKCHTDLDIARQQLWVTNVLPKDPHCEVCNTRLKYFSGDKATSVTFDHTRDPEVYVSPSDFIRSNSPTPDKIAIWRDQNLGIVCHKCNVMLGKVINRQRRFKAALIYIKKHTKYGGNVCQNQEQS